MWNDKHERDWRIFRDRRISRRGISFWRHRLQQREELLGTPIARQGRSKDIPALRCILRTKNLLRRIQDKRA